MLVFLTHQIKSLNLNFASQNAQSDLTKLSQVLHEKCKEYAHLVRRTQRIASGLSQNEKRFAHI